MSKTLPNTRSIIPDPGGRVTHSDRLVGPHAAGLRITFALAMLGLISLLSSGCVTTYQDQRARQEVREREDMLILQEEIRRLAGRVETLEMEIAQVYRDVELQKTESQRAQRTQRDQLDQRLAGVEQQVEAVDRARIRDREEIVQQLSATMAQLIREQLARAPARTPTRPAGSGYGYEHTVGPGETLSHIAAAYGVTTRAIIDANNLPNPDRLRVGQKLFIPE